MGDEFIFVIFDAIYVNFAKNVDGRITKRCLGIFDNLDQAKKAIERPNFKNFEWIDETHYKYEGILACHCGVIGSVPKNELYTIDFIE